MLDSLQKHEEEQLHDRKAKKQKGCNHDDDENEN